MVSHSTIFYGAFALSLLASMPTFGMQRGRLARHARVAVAAQNQVQRQELENLVVEAAVAGNLELFIDLLANNPQVSLNHLIQSGRLANASEEVQNYIIATQSQAAGSAVVGALSPAAAKQAPVAKQAPAPAKQPARKNHPLSRLGGTRTTDALSPASAKQAPVAAAAPVSKPASKPAPVAVALQATLGTTEPAQLTIESSHSTLAAKNGKAQLIPSASVAAPKAPVAAVAKAEVKQAPAVQPMVVAASPAAQPKAPVAKAEVKQPVVPAVAKTTLNARQRRELVKAAATPAILAPSATAPVAKAPALKPAPAQPKQATVAKQPSAVEALVETARITEDPVDVQAVLDATARAVEDRQAPQAQAPSRVASVAGTLAGYLTGSIIKK